MIKNEKMSDNKKLGCDFRDWGVQKKQNLGEGFFVIDTLQNAALDPVSSTGQGGKAGYKHNKNNPRAAFGVAANETLTAIIKTYLSSYYPLSTL